MLLGLGKDYSTDLSRKRIGDSLIRGQFSPLFPFEKAGSSLEGSEFMPEAFVCYAGQACRPLYSEEEQNCIRRCDETLMPVHVHFALFIQMRLRIILVFLSTASTIQSATRLENEVYY